MTVWIILVALLVFVMSTYCASLSRWDKPWVSRKGTASYMGAESHGKIMANGQPFNRYALTCASWHYPLGTMLLVVHDKQSVLVEVTDRGPARRLGREIDLSERAFGMLASLDLGLLENVTVTPVMLP